MKRSKRHAAISLGIMFQPEMVVGILAGRKTVTRRLVHIKECCPSDDRLVNGVPHNESELVDPKGNPNIAGAVYGTDPYLKVPCCSFCDTAGDRIRCRYRVGARLYVKEPWRTYEDPKTMVDGVLYRADGAFRAIENTREAVDDWIVANDNGKYGDKWRSPMMMPQWAARIRLVVKDVMVQRLNEVDDDDAVREGVFEGDNGWGVSPDDPGKNNWKTPRLAYLAGLYEIHDKREAFFKGEWNPWMFRIAFEVTS